MGSVEADAAAPTKAPRPSDAKKANSPATGVEPTSQSQTRRINAVSRVFEGRNGITARVLRTQWEGIASKV